MIKKNLAIAVRTLINSKIDTSINIIGLAVDLTCIFNQKSREN